MGADMLDLILTTVAPALLPAVADGARGLFNRLTGGAGAKPANVEETVTLMQAETERMHALAQLDAVGEVSQWVNNVRALQRPTAALLIVSGYVGAVAVSAPEGVLLELGAYAQMVTFYLFGDRTYMYLQNRRGQ